MPAHLSPDIKFLLHSATVPDAPLRLLVALRPGGGAPALPPLEAMGCTVRSQAGDVLSVECDLTALGRLAQSPLVLSIELGGPLFPESQT